MDDLVIRNVKSGVCDIVTCLSGVKVADITYGLDRLPDSAGEESVVIMHTCTIDIGKCSCVVIEGKFRLGRKSKVAF